MLIGVKYCGGCNPRFDRGKAFQAIKEQAHDDIEFKVAEEGVEYDYLLVIGGCSNCCASYCQYNVKNGTLFVWDGETHVDKTIDNIHKMMK
ncbi:MAG: hypothetical protein PHV71_05445 [Eubacteriales bacterium]|nr:hypothetical protein [Eubacteriales bacterium]MDD3199766.1 hypothetical protein [Eubacteriales bacterium]MDD4121669.1 hypothetical protein [Eubacteriales bacterium]MDD4630032.1 hypothetical protein [Eubacteriales bacterium]